MKTIELTKGKVALVDDGDYEWLSQWNWCYSGNGYARGSANSKHISMHRLIMGNPIGLEIDHINGDRLDNRRENLRLATDGQNCANQKKTCSQRASVYKGVTWSKRSSQWMAQIGVNKKHICLGYFNTEEEAAAIYDQAALHFFEEYARPNNPDVEKEEGWQLPERKQHRRKRAETTTSAYSGVSWHNSMEKWQARITVNKKRIHLGSFDNEEEAGDVWKKARLQYFGTNTPIGVIEKQCERARSPEELIMQPPVEPPKVKPVSRKMKGCSSTHKGVFWYKPYSKWGALLYVGKTKHFLGYFQTEEEAAAAYQQAIVQLPARKARNPYASSKRKTPCTSSYKGVSWNKARTKWQAHISLNKRNIYLGLFGTEEEAANAYKQALEAHLVSISKQAEG